MWGEDEEMRAEMGEICGEDEEKRTKVGENQAEMGEKWTKVGEKRAILGKSISSLYLYKNILSLTGRESRRI